MLIPFAIVLFIVLFECTTTDGRIGPPTENLRIAIVQVLTGPYVHKFGRFSAAVSCYAARHHYHHHVQNVPIVRPGVTNAHAFDTKIGVVKKYLPHYDWIFLLDSDAFPANFNCRLESYLEGSGDEVMLVVGMREWSIEVMSGGLFLRNVPNGHLFLEQWQQNFGTVPNTDNGALSKTIANWLREHDHLVPRHCRPRFENECRFWWGCYKNIRMYPPLHFAMRTGFNLKENHQSKKHEAVYPSKLLGNECFVHSKSFDLLDKIPSFRLAADFCQIGADKQPGNWSAAWITPELLISKEEQRSYVHTLLKFYMDTVPTPFIARWDVRQRNISHEAELFPNLHKEAC